MYKIFVLNVFLVFTVKIKCVLDFVLKILNWTFHQIKPKLHLNYKQTCSIQAEDLEYNLCKKLKQKPEDPDKCKFGKTFTDHMLSIKWDKDNGWANPVIHPLKNISLHPATTVFHYATEVRICCKLLLFTRTF